MYRLATIAVELLFRYTIHSDKTEPPKCPRME